MRVPPDQSSTASAARASARSGSRPRQLARDAREPRAEHERLDARARGDAGLHVLQQHPRVRRHRARHVADEHEPPRPLGRLAVAALEQLAAVAQRGAHGRAQVVLVAPRGAVGARAARAARRPAQREPGEQPARDARARRRCRRRSPSRAAAPPRSRRRARASRLGRGRLVARGGTRDARQRRPSRSRRASSSGSGGVVGAEDGGERRGEARRGRRASSTARRAARSRPRRARRRRPRRARAARRAPRRRRRARRTLDASAASAATRARDGGGARVVGGAPDGSLAIRASGTLEHPALAHAVDVLAHLQRDAERVVERRRRRRAPAAPAPT